MERFGVEISLIKKQMKNHNINCENTCSLNFIARTRVRTLQEFLLFCCHKCHGDICNLLVFSLLPLF